MLNGFVIELLKPITNGRIVKGIEQWRKPGDKMRVKSNVVNEKGQTLLQGDWLTVSSPTPSTEIMVRADCTDCYRVLPPWEWKNS